MKVVDSHAHFWPEPLLEFFGAGGHPRVRLEPDADGVTWFVHDGGLRYPLTPAFTDLEAKLEHMDRDGIDLSLDSIPAPFFLYELSPPETARLARSFNDAISEHSARSGGRVFGIATVPLNDPAAAAAELGRARRELGLVGVEIGTSLGARMLDDPELDPVFAAAAEHAMPVLVHPYLSMLGEGLPAGLDRFALPITVGNPIESATAASRLILGGVLDRHPELTVQLVHGGGFLPYQLGRLQRAYEVNPIASEVAERAPREYLGRFLIDTVLFERRAIEFLVELAGPERVAFGTDSPFAFADLTALEMADGLGEETARLVLGANAVRAYRLDSE